MTIFLNWNFHEIIDGEMEKIERFVLLIKYDTTIYHGIHFREKYAPISGTLREAGQNARNDKTFELCMALWKTREIDKRGIITQWNSNEIQLLEGCHRMIALAIILTQNETPTSDPPMIFIGYQLD